MKMKKIKPIANNINAITINFRREKLNQIIKIKINPKVAKVFKNAETNESSTWKDENGKLIKFYKLSDNVATLIRAYRSNTGRYASVSDFGSSELSDNFSILRSENIENGVNWNFDQQVLNDEAVKIWITNLAEFVKWVYISYIQIYEVKAVIKFKF
jgi:hypothetical protein